MEEYYQENSEFFDKILAQITIYVDADTGEICFGCDWRDDDTGILSISSIMYKLKHEDLVDKIIAALNQQCVKDNRLDDINKINSIIDAQIQKEKQDNDLVVRPRDNR